MRLSEKLLTIANNTSKVYNAGYEKGLAESGGGSGGSNEPAWVEDDSPVIYEKSCYQTVGISAYLTEQGTLTYKINGNQLNENYINRDNGSWWSYSNYNQIGPTHAYYTDEWIKVRQAEIIPIYEPRPEFVIRKIGNNAFACMHNLRIVKIPDTITYMGNSVFNGCFALQKVELPSGITSLGTSCFDGCSTLPQIVLPDTITSIGVACFRSCMSLTSINIPNGVSAIGSYTFAECRGLRHIDGLEHITSISGNAFDGCTSLEGTLIFNESIVFSGQNIFRNGYNLTTVIFRGTPSAIDGTMFNNCFNIKDIYVPWSEGEVANAPWSATNATIHYNTTYDADGNPIV